MAPNDGPPASAHRGLQFPLLNDRNTITLFPYRTAMAALARDRSRSRVHRPSCDAPKRGQDIIGPKGGGRSMPESEVESLIKRVKPVVDLRRHRIRLDRPITEQRASCASSTVLNVPAARNAKIAAPNPVASPRGTSTGLPSALAYTRLMTSFLCGDRPPSISHRTGTPSLRSAAGSLACGAPCLRRRRRVRLGLCRRAFHPSVTPPSSEFTRTLRSP